LGIVPHWPRVFEDTVLKKMLGPTRDKVPGEWRRLHNEKHNDLNSSQNIIRVIKSRITTWVGHVASTGERYGVFVGKPEGNRPPGRPRDRWENIKMDL
jgi:hypothetical protein